jgi:hypothetical protein
MELPGRVLDDWLAYWKVEPWSDQRADLRSGLQSAHFHKSMTGESVAIDKFLPDFETDVRTREQQELDQAVAAWEAISEGD